MNGKYVEFTLKQLKKSQREDIPYKVKINNKHFLVYPNVFSPKYFRDTSFFAQNLKFNKNEKFLDMGCGTGILGIIAALSGAIVTAIDINKAAVENTEENVKLHHLLKKLKIYEGDLYSPLSNQDKFDTIFWNVPFIYAEKENLTDLERSVINPKYKLIKRFFDEGKNYLQKDGRILIGFSKTIGRYDLLIDIARNAGFSFKKLIAKEIDYGLPIGKISLEIYQFKLKY